MGELEYEIQDDPRI